MTWQSNNNIQRCMHIAMHTGDVCLPACLPACIHNIEMIVKYIVTRLFNVFKIKTKIKPIQTNRNNKNENNKCETTHKYKNKIKLRIQNKIDMKTLRIGAIVLPSNRITDILSNYREYPQRCNHIINCPETKTQFTIDSSNNAHTQPWIAIGFRIK